jgi:hypothetical protein
MKRFAFAILAIVVTIALASCEKTPVEPENPTPVTPIDNPTYSSGIADQVVEFLTNEQGDTTAFQISYTSWMEVDGERVSVPLKVYYRVLDTIFYVPRAGGFRFDCVSEGHKKCSERQDGAVTIIDSAAYSVYSSDDYSFVLECTYQAAVCKIGNELQTMPYHRVDAVSVVNRTKSGSGATETHYYERLLYNAQIDIGNDSYYVPSKVYEYEPL